MNDDIEVVPGAVIYPNSLPENPRCLASLMVDCGEGLRRKRADRNLSDGLAMCDLQELLRAAKTAGREP